MKNILITGGLGMIGSTIANKLTDYNVTILDSELPRYGGNRYNINNIKDDVEIVKGDIRDKNMTDYLVKNMDIIFNLAGQVDYNYSMTNPFLDLDINCNGHLQVLESCRQYNPDVKLIFSGSRMQYGKIERNPVSESHPMNPLSIYGIHKLTSEKYYLAYNDQYGVKSTCFRISNPYGPRSQMKHSNYSVLNWFIRQAMEGNEITIFGDGNQLRDYIYVDDIADAMIQSAFSDKTNGEVYNLGSGEATFFIEMVETIIKIGGEGKIVKKEWPKHWKNVETGDFYSDMTKLKNDTGWKSMTTLEEGVKKTFDYYEKYKEHYW